MTSKRSRYAAKDLFTSSHVRTFTGNSLNEIAFPLGGIGAGNFSLGGRGNLRDWEIFNRPAKGRTLPYTFFAIWAKREGGEPVARVLEAQRRPPYGPGFGLPTGEVSGLPRLKEARFRGEYPFAWIDFVDDDLPLDVSLEAFTPFIPHNSKDSSIPAAIVRWRVKNRTRKPVQGTLVFSMLNPIGVAKEGEKPGNCFGNYFGSNLNQFVDESEMRGLVMSGKKHPSDDIRFGSVALVTTHEDITYTTHWVRTGWWDDIQQFWDDFSDDGLLKPLPDEGPTPDGRTDVGSLGLRFHLKPGETTELPFILTWHFPNRVNYWDSEPEVKGKPLKNYYASLWPDALAVAKYVVENLSALERDTRRFHGTLFSSTLPGYVLDAVSSQASIVATNTCLRTDDGSFFAFEGCADEGGCCPMNCTHVWNYEQAVAHLFPDLERSMRKTDFKVNTDEKGDMAFRTKLPVLLVRWKFRPAADGQMGTVMKLYREWKFSGDREFLEELWPEAKRALEYAWEYWDKDRNGILEGEQHNTYDIEFLGWTTMTSGFYLGALKAGGEMARYLGDAESAERYRDIFEKGKRKVEEELFNGEFYFQKYDPEKAKRYQYGEGCLSDQVLGQWFATVAGVGYLLDPAHIRKALGSIFKYNWRTDFSDHANVQRVYALNDEKGLVLCSWPKGGRPSLPFPYSDEVWTGIEYQVASHLIYEGFVKEGLSIVHGVRDRYNGERRNPWNEVECGNHYARAMASWAVLLALSGFRWDGVAGHIEFTPRVNEKSFRSFYSTGGGWGQFRQRMVGQKLVAAFSQQYGSQTIKSIALAGSSRGPKRVMVTKNGQAVANTLESDGEKIKIEFSSGVTLNAGDKLIISTAR
ncbi:MAG: GH116 family glycosyl-hydrolase [Bacteroidota bacterium]